MLRGVAILMVLGKHIPHDAPGGWRENIWFFPSFLAEFGYLGVPLFIVISGFCIHRSAAISQVGFPSVRISWREFWIRRFIRLYPPYVAAMAFSLMSAFWLHDHFPDPARFLGGDLVTHLLLVHNLIPEFATSLGNGALWSLGTEEQLYALYAVLLLLITRRSIMFAIAVAAVTTVAWRLLTPHLPELGPAIGGFHLGKWYQWPTHYWLHWALGALAVCACLGRVRLPAWCRSWNLAVVLLAVGMACNTTTYELLTDTRWPLDWLRDAGPAALSSVHNLGELSVLGSFFIIVNWSVARELRIGIGSVSGLLAWIGRISYSLYLVHVSVILILQDWLPLDSGGSPALWPLRYICYGLVSIAVGFVFHVAIERRFLGARPARPQAGVTAREADAT